MYWMDPCFFTMCFCPSVIQSSRTKSSAYLSRYEKENGFNGDIELHLNYIEKFIYTVAVMIYNRRKNKTRHTWT